MNDTEPTEAHTIPRGSDPEWPVPDYSLRNLSPEFWRRFDSSAEDWGSAPRLTGDLLSRKPHDVTPAEQVCSCGAKVLRCWAIDPEGPIGSRLTLFDPEPVEGGKWFMGADGSLTYEPRHGTYRLHDCGRVA